MVARPSHLPQLTRQLAASGPVRGRQKQAIYIAFCSRPAGVAGQTCEAPGGARIGVAAAASAVAAAPAHRHPRPWPAAT
eukprot:365362-Chlamydomonas_euryale.AAC.18